MKNILVIRPDAIGDCVLITPALAALKNKFPDAKIAVLAKELTRDVFLNNPNVDEIITDEKSIKKNKFDLSYQAWKRSYRVIYEPASTVYHLHNKTIKSFWRRSQIERISTRNRYFFRWKNFTDPWLVLLMALELCTVKLLNPNPTEWSGYFKALGKLPEILKRRQELRKYYRLTDQAVFAKFEALI